MIMIVAFDNYIIFKLFQHLQLYRSKYMICVAHIAPQKLKKLAVDTTAAVVPDHVTIEPIQIDKINCAKNTMLLTMATSVPSPRTCVPIFGSPSLPTSNCTIQ